jgi:PAS domain S-box-containing protein
MKMEILQPERAQQLDAALLMWTHHLAPHGIFTTDTNLCITSWNHWLERHSSLRAEQVLGQPLAQLIPSLSERHLDRYFQDALRGEVKVLSSALHSYLLPFPPTHPESGFSHMQQSARVTPLILEGRICGTITVVEDVTEREWQNRQLRHEHERDELLSDTLAHLLSARDPDALVKDLFNQFAAQLGVDTYLHYRLDPESQRLHLESSAGLTSVQQVAATTLEKGEGFCGAAALRRQPVTAPFLAKMSDPKAEFFRKVRLEAFIAFPLMLADQTLGVLAFGTRTREQWAVDELSFLQTIARYVAIALDRARQERTLRVSEERFRVMAETVPDIIFTASPGGRFDFVNQRFYSVTSLPEDAALHFGWFQALHEEDVTRVKEEWRNAVKSAEPFNSEFRLRDAVSQYRWFVARARPIREAQGRILKWFGAMTDVDEFKRTHLALREAQAQLKEDAATLEKTVAERTSELRETILQLESFSYTVAHDLRAPIRALDGYAQMVIAESGDRLSTHAREALNRIMRAAGRMDALTRDVLSYTKVATQKMDVVAVDPAPVIEDVIVMNSALQEPRAVVAIVRPLHRILAHPTLFSQCISNLLDNAAKFVAPGGQPRVIIRSEVVDANDPLANGRHRDLSGRKLQSSRRTCARYVRLWVEDNGIGMDSLTREKVFGMFERAREAKQYPGTGIGLAILAKAIERMNGRFGVESEPGAGSRFWIDLPPAPE